jgi:hypothetical protein
MPDFFGPTPETQREFSRMSAPCARSMHFEYSRRPVSLSDAQRQFGNASSADLFPLILRG